MKTQFLRLVLSLFVILALLVSPVAMPASTASAAPDAPLVAISLSLSAYTQDFNTLASTGTSSTVPAGWVFNETGSNANTTYTAGNGSNPAGDTYSFGTAASDRAFGGVRSGSLIPVIGAEFQNSTGSTISSLTITYTCEQWRLGATGRTDRMDFQYSTDATSLTTGTWNDVNTLDCSSMVTTGTAGLLDGNAMANRTTVSGNISSLAIANSNGFWIRWNDLDATGADDGLSVDDFSITPATGETAPSVASTTPANGATAVPATSNLTVTFSEPVDVTGSWFTITCTSSGAHTATVTGGPTTFTLNPDTDFAAGETCTATIVAAQVSDQDTNDPPDTMTADYSWSFGTAAPVGITKIHTIQGSGAGSPLLNSNVTIEGIVVGDFEVNGLKGFFVQEEDADADADVLTSEGIFVFDNNSTSEVALGDKVQVAGKVVEYSDRTVGTGTMTELSNVTITKTGTGSVTPASVTLPETTNGDLERYEGMLVSIVSPMTVAQNYFVGRYGQMTLSASGRLYQPTNQELPGSAAAAAIADLNARSMLILDDGQALARCGDNPNPVPYLGSPPPAVIRAGDSVSNLVGVLDYGQIDSGETDGCNVATALFTGDYRLHPVQAPSFSNVNTRPTAPNAVGGNVQVAAFNVLNYFNTFTGCTAGVGGATTDCRGAANATEFTRQRDKIIAAITTLDADVVGLMEIENDGYASSSAIQDLVNGLNAAVGAGTYAFINPDTTSGTNSLGTDAIKVGLLYKPAVVTPVGSTAVLNSAAFTDPLGTGTPRSRPALAQTFEENTWGERFTAVVNHLKSKGSCPGSGVDLDTGQGCWNATRTAAANYMVNTWLPTNPTGTGDPDVIILGDLNAYAREDPIETIKSAGYTNLINAFMGATAYSYIFDGQSGYLDHALAKNSLTAQVLDATEWHINADEPEVINYSTSFNPPGYYTANAYRASDHDPVFLSLD